MGKLKKMMKLYRHKAHHHHHRRHHDHCRGAEGIEQNVEKIDKKEQKRGLKKMKKLQKLMRNLEMTTDQSSESGPSVCCVCHHQLHRPEGSIEVLPCSHVYHQACLRALFDVSINDKDNPTVLCTKCQKSVDAELMSYYKNKLGMVTTRVDMEPESMPPPYSTLPSTSQANVEGLGEKFTCVSIDN